MNVALITGTREEVRTGNHYKIKQAVMWGGIVIVGDCPTGVDALVAELCPLESMRLFTADWDGLGKRAGPERNYRMVQAAREWMEQGELVICFAFPSRRSKGTWDCLKKAASAGITGRVVPL